METDPATGAALAPLPHSHREAHAALQPGQRVYAHFIWGDETPTEHTAAAEVEAVLEDHVKVRFKEDVPASGSFAGAKAETTVWFIPHECSHPHPRVEPVGG